MCLLVRLLIRSLVKCLQLCGPPGGPPILFLSETLPNRPFYACLCLTESPEKESPKQGCKHRETEKLRHGAGNGLLRVGKHRNGENRDSRCGSLFLTCSPLRQDCRGASTERRLLLGQGSPPAVRSVRQQIVSLSCPCSCQLRPPPAQSLLVHGHRHPGATSVGQQPGGRVWLPSFHPSSFSTCPQGLSRPHPLAVGPCHLSLPVATLWNGIQKSAILVSALVGRLGSLAQNSRERQNIRATVGKITVPLNDRLCLSGTKRLTDFNRGHMVFRNDEETDVVGSGDMPRARGATGTPGRTQ